MAVIFRCPHCDKKIETPDELAGRRVKCPNCDTGIRVPPKPDEEAGTLTVAPLDVEAERERKRLISDSLRLNQIIMQESADEAGEGPGDETSQDDVPLHREPLSDLELHDAIVQYLRCVADGQLEQAARLSREIVPHGPAAIAIIDTIALRGIPEEALADIPPQVLSGLIRNLRAEF